MRLTTPTTRYASLLIFVLLSIENVAANCIISAQGVMFGAYNSLASAANESAGLIEVSCSTQTSYQVSLSSGSGVYTERVMTNGAHSLIYNLYTDPSYSFIWGDGSGVTNTVSSSTSTTQLHDIYGRIPAQQDVNVGTYTDVIMVTIEF